MLSWCGRWDSNPRTPTGQEPQSCAFDLAWQLPRETGQKRLNTCPNWLSLLPIVNKTALTRIVDFDSGKSLNPPKGSHARKKGNRLLPRFQSYKGEKSSNAHPPPQSALSERIQNLRLGTLRPTPRRWRPRWSRQSWLEASQMVKRHQVRMDHQRKRIQIHQSQDRPDDQHRTVKAPNGPTAF
jgi:hypothetical protein